MATTVVTDYTVLPVIITAEALRDLAQGWLEVAQGDLDKAGDVEDAEYYAGVVDACRGVLDALTGAKPDDNQEEAPCSNSTTRATTRS
jgi:hypothetical protein